MAIREKEFNGKTGYEVSINLRSKLDRSIRVQLLRTQISTLRQAQAVEKELIREAAAEIGRREGTAILWGDLIEKYELAHSHKRTLMTKEIQVNTLRENVAMLRTYTKDWLHMPCPEINPGHVKKVLVAMDDDGYSRSRLKAIRGCINTVFRWAIEEGVLKGLHSSPAKGIDLGKPKDEKPPMILNLAEIRKLLDSARAMDHEWYPIWSMALHSGMRSGELYAVEWTDIDWDNNLITVSKSYNNRMNVTKSTKAGYWRKVPINSELLALLKELKLKAQPGEVHILPRVAYWRRGEGAKILREFCVGIGIPSVSFHTLRACFATHLLNAGVTSPVVKKICGWTDEKVMTRYIRLAGIDVSGATEVLDFVPEKRLQSSKKKVVNLDIFRSAKSEDQGS